MRIRHIAESNRRLRPIASDLNHTFLRENVMWELALADEFQTWPTSAHRRLSVLGVADGDSDLAQRRPPIDIDGLDGEVFLVHEEMVASMLVGVFSILILRLDYRTDYRRCGGYLETIILFEFPHRQDIAPIATKNVSNAMRLRRVLVWNIPL